MKVDHIAFVGIDGRAEPRSIFGVGRVNGLYVGQEARDAVEGVAIVDSLDFDPRSGVVLIRKRAAEGGNPAAARAWNRSPGDNDRHVADVCGIHIGLAHFFANDADQKQQPAPKPQVKPDAEGANGATGGAGEKAQGQPKGK